LKECYVILNRIETETDKKLANVSTKLINKGVEDTLITIIFDLLLEVEKVTVRMTVKLPENDEDKRYQRQLFQTSIDVAKFFKGQGGNYITNAILGNFFTSIDFEPKFPMPKVKFCD
jgi:hypothetical protein